MAGIATGFTQILFETVDFLDHRNGDDQVIIFELENTLRVMKQYIGIQNISFFHYIPAFFQVTATSPGIIPLFSGVFPGFLLACLL
jgi:hypothetical protein